MSKRVVARVACLSRRAADTASHLQVQWMHTKIHLTLMEMTQEDWTMHICNLVGRVPCSKLYSSVSCERLQKQEEPNRRGDSLRF